MQSDYLCSSVHVLPLSFCSQSLLARPLLNNFSVAIEKIDKFLKEQDVKYYIKTDLYVDREYSDWKERGVVIGVNKNQIYISNIKAKNL